MQRDNKFRFNLNSQLDNKVSYGQLGFEASNATDKALLRMMAAAIITSELLSGATRRAMRKRHDSNASNARLHMLCQFRTQPREGQVVEREGTITAWKYYDKHW